MRWPPPCALGCRLVAIDGPVVAGWPDLVIGLGKALSQRGFEAEFMEMGAWRCRGSGSRN